MTMASNLSNIVTPSPSSCNNAENISVKLPEIKLPEFDGAYSNYMEFRDSFMSLVDNNTALPKYQKLNYLKSACHGEAADLLKPLKHLDANYDKAWKILKDHYEDKRSMAKEHFKNLFEIPSLIKPSAQSIKMFLSTILTEVSSLTDLLGGIDEHMLLYLCETKLDHATRLAWEANIQADKDRDSNNQILPNLKRFENFLRSRYKVLENSNTNPIKFNADKGNNKLVNSKKTYTHVSVNNISCPVCQGTHYLFSCKRFLDMSASDRYAQVKNKQLCTNCLRAGHSQRYCRVRTSCKICHKRHNFLLHNNVNDNDSPYSTSSNTFNKNNDSVSNNTITQSNTQSHVHSSTESQQCNTSYMSSVINSNTQDSSLQLDNSNSSVLLPTAIVGVYDSKNNLVHCRALLDSGSQSNFVSTNFINRLGIKTNDMFLSVYGISQYASRITKQASLKFKSLQGEFSKQISCLVIENITNIIPEKTFDTSHLKLPNNIRMADPEFNKSANIDLLLGASLFFELLCIGQFQLGRNLPIVQKTKLGWVISGGIFISSSSTCFSGVAIADMQLNKQLQQFWLMDENYPEQVHSKEELECESHFIQTHERDRTGRFVIKLPFKENRTKLGDSLQNAIKRFYSLERRFDKNSMLKSAYSNFIKEYQLLGHMVKVDPQIRADVTHYLPHHSVEKNDSTTTKLRVVFDASSKTASGLSLNHTLKVGPTIQNDLFTILVRFRQHNIVLIGDIAKMYRQINVHPDEQDFQRIVWREDPNLELQHYKLTTLTYGTAPASFIATRCLQQLAHEAQEEFPVESSIIINDFYMDDLLTGCNDVSEMIKIRENLTSILKKGCFELRKFASNNKLVLQTIECQNNLSNYVISDNENIKTLGISWQPYSDVFEYHARKLQFSKITKRTILSYVSQIFDPLGLLGPIVVQAKLILQRLWQMQIDWDESIPSDLYTIWSNFQSQLEEFTTMKISRCVLLPQSLSIQIHGFCDASQTSFGAAIYIRSQNRDNIQSSLLCAKSRVAPIKPVSIPRLELSSAVILARLYKKIRAAFKNIQIREVYFWTDSTIVLSWLSAEPHLWQTFVANRVSEIQQLTPVDRWYHVRSHYNPADIISRGASPKELSSSPLWWNGPDFLLQPESAWPKDCNIAYFSKIESNIPEIKKSCITLTSTLNCDIFERYSNLFRLQRITALCLRFANNAKSRVEDRVYDRLSLRELTNSLYTLIRVVQTQSFVEDILSLTASKQLSKNSKISTLNPFVDQNGILRVGGRLRHSSLAFDNKHPIILPAKHIFTKMMINYEHQRHFHAGPQVLLNIIRQKYWPLNARQTIKATLRKCITCFRARPQGIIQQMGDLPDFRVTPARIFSASGVDYCGPFNIKEGKCRKIKVTKGYICIFVCLASKAVHVELVSDLTTQSFINAFKRFVSRRGLCKKLWSDNGSNFVGARNEFLEIRKLLETDMFHNYLAQSGIEWNFIPANSPHMGGLWEAAVRSVKYYLKRVTNGFNFTFEEFYTLLTQVEAILNSRPLVPLSHNPDDQEAITPGHFIIGEALISVPQPSLDDVPVSHLSRYQHICRMSQRFWKQWSTAYLHQLQQRTKWRFSKEPNLTIDSLVLLKDDNRPPMHWPMGRIIAIHPGLDNLIRVISVQTKNGVVKRSVARVCLLPLDNP